jgi:hypothetical protein
MTLYECTTASGNIIRTTSQSTAEALGKKQVYFVGKGTFPIGESNYRIVEPGIQTTDLGTRKPLETIDTAVGF